MRGFEPRRECTGAHAFKQPFAMNDTQSTPKLSDIERILKMAHWPMSKLRQKNAELERAYNGKRSRAQLVYQIVFLRDAPDE